VAEARKFQFWLHEGPAVSISPATPTEGFRSGSPEHRSSGSDPAAGSATQQQFGCSIRLTDVHRSRRPSGSETGNAQQDRQLSLCALGLNPLFKHLLGRRPFV